ncbi:hypothetical protein DR864_04430 [Runella rosea]|uniref:Uncharacterized protein n=1 Tax=Runella rosea TaxID=2259595 RepID=A0A344TEG2_9BACT|nr:hypothetical protein DR864_04430 [Runella rosea]
MILTKEVGRSLLWERANAKRLEILFITFNFTITRVEVLNSKKQIWTNIRLCQATMVKIFKKFTE